MIPQSSDVFSAGNAPVGAGRFKLFCFHRCGLALSLSLASAIFLCGCHKKTLAASQAPEPVPAPAAAAAPASHGPAAQPLPASSQAIAANATASEVAGQLTMELRRYVAYTRSIPKNFEDFTAHDPIKFPPPPPGKRYVITGGQIVLQ
jgi:hypothetical protein